MRECGDVIAAGRVFAEIGEVAAGVQSGRTSADDITLFKSVGVAIEHIVTADLVYRKAVLAQAAVEHHG
jgi:ornithine cyclodeaminase/alanine dehydrogenase-like protein (mu-crystallin family)